VNNQRIFPGLFSSLSFARSSRRDLLRGAAFGAGGLALANSLGGNLTLATEPSGNLDAYPGIELAFADDVQAAGSSTRALQATESNVLGPFHRTGAPYPPYYARITPPYEPGTILFVSGKVYGLDTGKPLANAIVDVWQADEKGHYDNDDLNKPPAANFYHLRGRMLTGNDGRYAYETIHPGAYYESVLKSWRPAHIHYMVTCPGYDRLVTQMYFKGDKYNATDRFVLNSLIMPVNAQQSHGRQYESVNFDIVLKPKP
jgi:catechol 1,2-dioxygenase